MNAFGARVGSVLGTGGAAPRAVDRGEVMLAVPLVGPGTTGALNCVPFVYRIWLEIVHAELLNPGPALS
jgi:hypothetical protein